MARRRTSTPTAAPSPAADSPPATSIASRPATELPSTSDEAAALTSTPKSLDPSPESDLSEAAAAAVELITIQGLHGAVYGQLAVLVEALDAYARAAGSWDDVLLQLELAKALLAHAPQS